VNIRRRHFLVSAIIPYFFMLLLGFGLLMISLISASLQTVDAETLNVFGMTFRTGRLSGLFLYVLGVSGIIIVLTAIYLVMPVGHLSVRHALVGGATAGILWEIVRHVLVWYYSSLSLVNVVYGSLAASVVALLSLEVGAIILLLGAQVIAEYERIEFGTEDDDGALETDP
jgi:YihY family inner membrane protein